MKTEWDYTQLADAYLERPAYAVGALSKMYIITGLKPGDTVCDIGAGVAHLTLPLAKYGCTVDAVEPNDAMRTNGQRRTANFASITWYEGTGEHTKRPSNAYDLVTFGSSFNVCDRQKAMKETCRLLKPHKYFACMWNHRDLDDPVQRGIENIIRQHIKDYDYGTRREDQRPVIEGSGLFEDIHHVEGTVQHTQTLAQVVEAWRSHATLHRQAGSAFQNILLKIENFLSSLEKETIVIPYTTRIWVARKKG